MSPVKSVGDTQDGGESLDALPRLGIQLAVVRMLRTARLASAVVSSDVGDDDLVRGGNAEQVGVANQVKRVLVMSFVVDVVSHIVQDRGICQQHAVGGLAAESCPDRVEQLQGQALHVSRMRFFVMAALGE